MKNDEILSKFDEFLYKHKCEENQKKIWWNMMKLNGT